jgi:hypothetical protein
MNVKPRALLGFDMALPLRVRLQAGHLINEMILFCLFGEGITFPVFRAGSGRRSVSLRVYCVFVLEPLIDCLTWLTVNPISKSTSNDTPSQFYQLWKISQRTQRISQQTRGILSGMQLN